MHITQHVTTPQVRSRRHQASGYHVLASSQMSAAMDERRVENTEYSVLIMNHDVGMEFCVDDIRP